MGWTLDADLRQQGSYKDTHKEDPQSIETALLPGLYLLDVRVVDKLGMHMRMYM